jgi:hypothetical protein
VNGQIAPKASIDNSQHDREYARKDPTYTDVDKCSVSFGVFGEQECDNEERQANMTWNDLQYQVCSH